MYMYMYSVDDSAMLPPFLGKEVDDLITELLNPVSTMYFVCKCLSSGTCTCTLPHGTLMYMYKHVFTTLIRRI